MPATSNDDRVTYDPATVRRDIAESQVEGLGLFDAPAPAARHTDPETSHAAAESMGLAAGKQRSDVLAALADGPATAAELDQRLDWPWTTANRRMKELERLGLVERTGETRPTPRGRSAEVWQATNPRLTKEDPTP